MVRKRSRNKQRKGSSGKRLSYFAGIRPDEFGGSPDRDRTSFRLSKCNTLIMNDERKSTLTIRSDHKGSVQEPIEEDESEHAISPELPKHNKLFLTQKTCSERISDSAMVTIKSTLKSQLSKESGFHSSQIIGNSNLCDINTPMETPKNL